MLRVLTSAQMRLVDRWTIDELGLPGAVLMDHAGLAVARAAWAMLGHRPGRVLVACGKGNNGGDGFVAARWLAHWACEIDVWIAGDPDQIQGDARVNLDLWIRLGGRARRFDSTNPQPFEHAVASCLVAVDALLGTGVDGAPRSPVSDVIDCLNNAAVPLLSVDVPSGLNADSGQAAGSCIRAARTVTLAAYKRGLLAGAGPPHAGEVSLADIGVPAAAYEQLGQVPWLVRRDEVERRLPPRALDAHKGNAGRVLVIAGSAAMPGAAALCARSAARGGAGLVTLATPAGAASVALHHSPEIMALSLPENADGRVGDGAFEAAREALMGADAVAIGPGLGTHEEAAALLRAVTDARPKGLVLDADALTLLSRDPENLGGAAILTPHPGEAARLLDCDVATVQADRWKAVSALARRYHAVALLKGPSTLIAAPDGRMAVNTTGNAAMASGGMGDALTGLVAALLGQGLEPFDVAVVAAWLHGRAGDLAAAGSDAGLLASDLIDHLPRARADLRRHPVHGAAGRAAL